MKYAVCCWPNVQQMSTIVRVCRSFEAAKKVANKSDRLFVLPAPENLKYCKKGYRFLMENTDWKEVIYMIPQQNDKRYGSGRFGNGLRSRFSAPWQKDMDEWKRREKWKE